MKTLSLLLSLLLWLNCASCSSQEAKGDSSAAQTEYGAQGVLPFELELLGVLDDIEDTGRSIPPIRVSINQERVKITVGATESYQTPLRETRFPDILPYLQLSDFQDNQYHYNRHLQHGGIIKMHKEIAGTAYTKTISNYKRRDIPVEYLAMDSMAIFKTYHLSRIANEFAISLIKDSVRKEDMIVAYSMEEALANPGKVYELHLRNQKQIRVISPEIRQLVNLRVLNVSGTNIKAIPPEIGECYQLKKLIANATPLRSIAPEIGQLQKIRIINFGYCKLKTIPPEIGNLTSLWSLGLGSNQLEQLPATIANLKNVSFFDVSNNRLKSFPPSLLGLEMVGNLWIHKNAIDHIPTSITNLPRLHHFLVNEQAITNIAAIRNLLPAVRVIHQD